MISKKDLHDRISYLEIDVKNLKRELYTLTKDDGYEKKTSTILGALVAVIDHLGLKLSTQSEKVILTKKDKK